MRGQFGLLVTLFAVVSLPFASAVPSGLTYLDSTWSSLEGDGGELIAMNPNGTILASYHGKDILFFNTTTLDRIGSISFDEDISAMKFNPNGSLLAINKRSTVHLKESIRLIDINEMQVLESSVQADDSFRNIAWSVDGTILAAQGYDGDVEQYRIPSLTLKNTLQEVHVVDVTCIDYRSDGQYILTGDEAGRWAVWDLQGQRQGPYREFGQELLDCKFSPDGNDIVFMGVNGNFASRGFGGSEKHSMIVDGGKEIIFSGNGNRMHVAVESNSFYGLNTYNYETFDLIQNTTFFHTVEDIEMLEDSSSRLQSLYVAAGTGEIAVYLRELIPFGYNSPGVDLDGDNVPDNLDPDDDGDGVNDDWDDDFGCDAPEGTPCSRYPDLDKIRNIEIFIGEEFVVRDSITLPTEDSSNIRNLSRNAIARDQVISASETQLFADAICKNMDHGDIIDQLKETIEISSGELGDAVVRCNVVSGMELIRDGDSTTQITIAITTTFQYATMVTLPLDISLKEQTLPTDGSIAWLAPAHPISLTFRGDGVETEKIPLWWNDGETTASITINQVSVKNPTAVDSLLDYALHPVAFLLYLAIIGGALTLVIRKQNEIDFNIDDEEDHEENEIDESEDEFFDKPQSVYTDSKDSLSATKPKSVENSAKRKVTRKDRQKRESTTNVDTEPQKVTKRRKVSSTDLNKSGPIMKTKRKRLVSADDSNEEIEPVGSNEEPRVKTRKVKAKSEISEKPVKKRRAVKKSIDEPATESIYEKKVDEEKLQKDLVKDFIAED
ncbi:MAG: hypothetical protein ACPID5_00905 [Candidatus Poseidoniaceae archaeon]